MAAILAGLRETASQAKDHADTVTASATKTAVDKAKAKTASTRAARVPEELLRALGARGRGFDSDYGGAYGLSLLAAVEDVAAEAFACGEGYRGAYELGDCVLFAGNSRSRKERRFT